MGNCHDGGVPGGGNNIGRRFTECLSVIRQFIQSRREPVIPNYNAPPIPETNENERESFEMQIRGPRTLQEIYVAMYEYDARGPSELTFTKGEKMVVLDKTDEDWWMVRMCETHQEGFVPMLYIQLATALESQEWFFGRMGRPETYQLLMSPFNGTGAFLIRESESWNGFVLSVRTRDEDEIIPNGELVKHFRIPKWQDGRVYLVRTKVFDRLQDLVEHYRNDSESVFYQYLKYPCKRNAPILQDISWDTKDKWEISRSTLQYINKLGQGSFGEVWSGYWNHNVDVAIKTLKEGTMTVEAFMAEAQIMKGLKHPNILVLYAVCTQKEPILIVTEYMSEGSLLDYLRSDKGKALAFNDQIYIAAQVAAGMAYLEDLNLIHRDLAARNVLVGPSLTCKVADFGLARALEGDCYNTSVGKFPVKWTAPEALMYNSFTIKSDVWSFGILAMEIVTYGVVPYPGMSNSEVTMFISNGGRMNKPANCPNGLYELVYKCWMQSASDRPTFSYLHDTLNNYDISTENMYK